MNQLEVRRHAVTAPCRWLTADLKLRIYLHWRTRWKTSQEGLLYHVVSCDSISWAKKKWTMRISLCRGWKLVTYVEVTKRYETYAHHRTDWAVSIYRYVRFNIQTSISSWTEKPHFNGPEGKWSSGIRCHTPCRLDIFSVYWRVLCYNFYYPTSRSLSIRKKKYPAAQ